VAPYVFVLEIGIDLRDARDLKEKRKVVSSLKAQIRQRFVASVAEIDAHDDRRRAVILSAWWAGPSCGSVPPSWSDSSTSVVRTGARSVATCSRWAISAVDVPKGLPLSGC
jgi:hypothetical protein